MNWLNRFYELRKAGRIKRFHTRPVLKEQTLADHSWGVAMIVMAIHPTASVALIKAALTHDLAELATGDIPAPIKWGNAYLSGVLEEIENEFNVQHDIDYLTALSEEEASILKFADGAELLLRSVEEMSMGNATMLKCYNKVLPRLQESTPNMRAEALLESIMGKRDDGE